MTTLADKSLLSGGDNKPPMLEKHLYDSWKSRMELYMMNRPHGRMILASVEKGPLVWPSITEDGVTRLKEYVELTPAEAIQADCDIKAINIILQGLPTEIYALVSQHRVAKDLWEKIKLLMQGTSLTKQERECKLYDEFDKFTYKKGETLTHDTNVDQLHAYLQQHERHANEVRLMHERNLDPLALVASHQLTQPAYQSHLHTHPQSLSQLHVSPYQSSQFVTVRPPKCGIYSGHGSWGYHVIIQDSSSMHLRPQGNQLVMSISKRRIIAVTKVEIVEWHDYKHLDWITIRRDDDVLYKFKEGDFHRLRIQDIEDIVANPKAWEDLNWALKTSYQKKPTITKPDTYRSRAEKTRPYTPYLDQEDSSYDNKDKKTIDAIDELHKSANEFEVLKLKKFQERCNIKAFQEWYEHVGPEVASPQDGKVTRWRRDCAWLMISRCSRSQCQIQVQGTSSIQEVNDHYSARARSQESQEYRAKD
ncbi:hypothetical protein Tco_1476684 [Tanacetum coccineum]